MFMSHKLTNCCTVICYQMAQTTFDRARCFNCPLAHSKGKRSCTDHDETIIREALLKISVFLNSAVFILPNVSFVVRVP